MTTYTDGTYRAEIIDQGFSASQNEKLFFYLRLRVRQRIDESGTPQECPQYERTVRQYLSNVVGEQILLRDLRAIGVVTDDIFRLGAEASDHIDLLGRVIDVTCNNEIYNGKTQERWTIARPAPKKLTLDAARALAARTHMTPPPAPPAAPPAPEAF